MTEYLTRVELGNYPERYNHRLRFGAPDIQQELDRRRALALFKPQRIFGYIRWRANEYGGEDWLFAVVKTQAPSQSSSPLEGVHPGGDALLLVAGNAKVKRALLQIDVLEAEGFDPAQVSPDYYRHVHNRVMAGRPIRAYSQEQHAAHLALKAVSA